MAIIRQEDVVNGGEIVVVSGVVERIIIKEAERTAKNLEFGVTHIASLCVDQQWINYISLGIKEGRDPDVSINAGTKAQPKWVQIQESDEVKVVVTEKIVGGKAYYNAKKSGIKLVKKNATPGQQPQQPQQAVSGGSNFQAKSRDNSGQSCGHAINGAMNFILTYGQDNSNENIVALAKKVHDVTERVKAEYKKMEPSLSDYDNGAASGQSVLTACKLVGVDGDFEEGVYALAIDLLGNVVPKVMTHVKGGDKAPAPTVKTTRAAVKPKAATKATPVVEETFPDLDDPEDVPF